MYYQFNVFLLFVSFFRLFVCLSFYVKYMTSCNHTHLRRKYIEFRIVPCVCYLSFVLYIHLIAHVTFHYSRHPFPPSARPILLSLYGLRSHHVTTCHTSSIRSDPSVNSCRNGIRPFNPFS